MKRILFAGLIASACVFAGILMDAFVESEVAYAQQWRGRYAPPGSGSTVNQTFNTITVTEVNTTEIYVTEQITIQETVDVNLIYDVVGDVVEDWWDMVDTTDGKKKGGKGNPSDNADTVVYYWDVNGVYWHEPNAAPDTVAEGEYQWDSDDDAFEVYDGTQSVLVAQKVQKFAMTVYDPDTIQGTADAIPVLPVETEMFPGGITLLSVGIKTNASSTYSVNFEDFNAPGDASPDTIETVATSASLEAEDDGTLTKSAIAAGSIIYIDLPADDIDVLQVWGTYYVNDND